MSTSIHNLQKRRSCGSNWPSWAPHLPDETTIGRRSHGHIVTDHRTSWVRRFETDRGSAYVKTYQYEGWVYHLKSLGRRTAPWSTGRAAREFDALQWLREHGLSAPEPLLVLEHRRFGFLQSATLVTAAYPGTDAAALLPNLAPSARSAAIDAIANYVRELHRAGFRDGNLDLRNLLLQQTNGGFQVAKVDSPRYRIRPPGAVHDRWTQADWQRLQPQLLAAARTLAATSRDQGR